MTGRMISSMTDSANDLPHVPPPPAVPPSNDIVEPDDRFWTSGPDPEAGAPLPDCPVPEPPDEIADEYRDDLIGSEDREWAETQFTNARRPGRIYASRSFSDRDLLPGFPRRDARFVRIVLDPEGEMTELEYGGSEWTIRTTPKGRFEFKVLVSGTPGNVRELWIERFTSAGKGGASKNQFHLTEPEASALIGFLKELEFIPVEGTRSVRMNKALLDDIIKDPNSVRRIYGQKHAELRELIAEDEKADDVIAIAHRRSEIGRFRRLLEDTDYFEQERRQVPGGQREQVWQQFFENNKWILGLSVSSQMLTSWDNSKLEQVVGGHRVGASGKRADAFMRTVGLIRSMVFVEFKRHDVALLEKDDYRSGCWPPSEHLSGGVAQSQGTLYRAVADIGERLNDLAQDNSEVPGSHTYLIRPRSYLLIGTLKSLTGAEGGDHVDKVRSFELYRRSLVEPDVITFDELLARAEWLVPSPERAAK